MHNKKIIIISSIVLCLVVLGIATSYALYTFNVTGDTVFRIGVGNLELSISDNETDDVFVMENVYPIKDEVGLSQDGYTFTVTNTGSLKGDYSVYLDDVVLENETHQLLSKNLVKFNLVNNETGVSKTDFLTNFSDSVIDSGTLEPNESVTYTLKMWVDYNAGNEAQNKYFAARVRIDGTQHAVISDTPVTPGAKSYTIVNDANSNGTADIGDEIAIGSEHFYVISNDGTKIDALAKYNLYVGGKYDESINPGAKNMRDNYFEYTTEATGIQNSSMGPVAGTDNFNGSVLFAPKNEDGAYYWNNYNGKSCSWYLDDGVNCGGYTLNYVGNGLKALYGQNYPANVYDSNSNIYGYIENYVDYLNTTYNVNASGRLMSIDQAKNLGCSSSGYCGATTYICSEDWEIEFNYNGCGGHNIGDSISLSHTCSSYDISSNSYGCASHSEGDIVSLDGNAPSWVYSTSYWLGDAIDNYGVANIETSGNFDINDGDLSKGYTLGVRPVITIGA